MKGRARQMNEVKKMSKKRMIFTTFLCLLCLSVGQGVQFGTQKLLAKVTGENGVENIVSGILYVVVVYVLLKLICKYVMRVSLAECRIGRLRVSFLWMVVAIFLPAVVNGVFMLLPGGFEGGNLTATQNMRIAMQAIFVYGFGAGMVEEMIFRGVMFHAIEEGSGRKCAIFISSFIFTLGHVAIADNVVAVITILGSGLLVSIMFCLITLECDSIWSSVIVHAVWNGVTIGGILDVSTVYHSDKIFSYIVDRKFDYLFGGYITVEPSYAAMVAYFVLICILIYRDCKMRRSFHLS